MTPELVAALQDAVGITAGTFADRLSAAPTDAQALYRQILPAFAATGRAPDLDDAAAAAALTPQRAARATADLAAADLIALTPDGRLAGVFPLSAEPTRHRVDVHDGPILHAMCAVDALGIPAMLASGAVITSIDPATGQQLEVTIDTDGTVQAEPTSTVVLLARAGDGPLASACCSIIDFYQDVTHADAALGQPGMQGTVLTLADAHALGAALFRDLPAL